VLASRGFRFDVAFTSELRRASQTCELALSRIPGHTSRLAQSALQREALGIVGMPLQASGLFGNVGASDLPRGEVVFFKKMSLSPSTGGRGNAFSKKNGLSPVAPRFFFLLRRLYAHRPTRECARAPLFLNR
jgi:hypothetical protein